IGMEGDHTPSEAFVIDLANSKNGAPTAIDFACLESDFWLNVFGDFRVREFDSLETMAQVRDHMEGRSSKVPLEPSASFSCLLFLQKLRKEAFETLAGSQSSYHLQDFFEAFLLQQVRSLLYENIAS